MNESAEPALRVAQWLGAHALPLFFVALVAVLLLAAVGWWALQRYTRPRSESRLPPLVFLLLRIRVLLKRDLRRVRLAGWEASQEVNAST